MFTFDFVFNVVLTAGSMIWLILLPFIIGRIIRRRSKRTFLSVSCSSVNAFFWLLSVWFPFHRHGTLNTEHDGTLFLLGIAAAFFPNLVGWWQTRYAKAA